MRASGYARTDKDWYQEPSWLVDLLLDVENFSGELCWDPACGAGNIPERVKARGMDCLATDIVDRGYDAGVVDFFQSLNTATHIISNPPYGVIQAWVDECLERTTGKVAILARLAFLESQRRKPWFKSTPLARVWVCSRRPSMPPGGRGIKATGGSIPFAWFVWEHGHKGRAEVDWL